MSAPTIPFALSPALIHVGVIDYSVPHGAKLYHEAVKSLYDEGFDVTSGFMILFLSKVKARGQRCGWHDVLNVPEDAIANPAANLHNLIDAYGELTLQQVIIHAGTYITGQNRQAQNSSQLYHCLTNSLSQEGMSKVSIWEDQYTSNGIPSGPALLKIIIRESSLDTQATVRNIREQLTSLDTYLPRIGNDITKLNLYVRELMNKLSARGKTTEESTMLVNLFKAYKAASDDVFVRYIEKKEDDYDDGTAISPTELMQLAANKYKNLNDSGKWNTPSAQEEKLIALESRIKTLTMRSKKDAKPMSFRKSTLVPKLNKETKRTKRVRPAWMTIKPDDISKPKDANNKRYWWCERANVWALHKPEDCKALPNSKEAREAKAAKAKLVEATAAIQEGNSSEDE
jgi:hypothetical protein